jgi:hypothetical protein
MNDRCLTDEEMAAYVDGVVGPTLRPQVEEHLARCRLCLHKVAELKRLVGAGGPVTRPVPAGILARVEMLIEARTRGLHDFGITAALKEGVLKILETTGNLLTPRRPSTVALRGRPPAGLSPRIGKSLSGYSVTVELVPARDTVQPVITLVDEAAGERPDGIKVSLRSSEGCETRYTHDGNVVFTSIGHGAFTMDIEGIGRIDLDIRPGSTG